MATGLLLAMAALYIVSRSMEPQHPAWGFLRAFAEAGMVGGLADWFAVTALFRHPMGLPIPHTAIIPRNKDRIGDTLAAFLKDNFLTPVVISRRMRTMDIAGAAGRFLTRPDGGQRRLRHGAARMIGDLVASLDQEHLGGLARSALRGQLEKLDVAPLIGQVIAAMMDQCRHRPVIDGIIAWIAVALDDSEQLVLDVVHSRASKIMRWTGLDETIAKAIARALGRLMEEVAADPDHRLRVKAEEALAKLAHNLQHDAALQARVEEWKQELLANPAIGRWIGGMWEQARRALLHAARNPEAVLMRYMGDTMARFGASLQENEELKRQINRFARRAIVGTAAAYGDGIVTLVSDTIRSWDVRTVTGRIEEAVGKDLQFIRINGTLVGGLVGVLLHLVGLFL